MGSESQSIEMEALRIELRELGASMFQQRMLEGDVDRARSAIAQAYERGAGNPLSYAISLFRSETFLPEAKRRPKPLNAHARIDPTRTDEGERVWQASEVDDGWRREYLADCIDALVEGRDPSERYLPSASEFETLTRVARTQASEQVTLRDAARALAGWATVWGFDDLRGRLEEFEPGMAGEPDLAGAQTGREDDSEPVGALP